MEILALFFLGIIQGLTEFLPVSSSGHLVLFSKIFGLEESLFLSILLHVATLLSIIVVFYKQIWKLIRHPLSKASMLYVIATIPTCLIALCLLPIIKIAFDGSFLPFCFLITAIILFCSEIFVKRNTKKISYKEALLIGVAQGFAIFPGISRSGATISTGLFCGVRKEETAQFSFLLSMPIILMSLAMEIVDISKGGIQLTFPMLGVSLAFLAAFVVGVFAIKIMIKVTEKSNLKWFSFYLLIITLVSLFIV